MSITLGGEHSALPDGASVGMPQFMNEIGEKRDARM